MSAIGSCKTRRCRFLLWGVSSHVKIAVYVTAHNYILLAITFQQSKFISWSPPDFHSRYLGLKTCREQRQQSRRSQLSIWLREDFSFARERVERQLSRLRSNDYHSSSEKLKFISCFNAFLKRRSWQTMRGTPNCQSTLETFLCWTAIFCVWTWHAQQRQRVYHGVNAGGTREFHHSGFVCWQSACCVVWSTPQTWTLGPQYTIYCI